MSLRKLSECEENINLVAYCSNCKEFFIDDLPNYSSLICPNQVCNYGLHRRLEIMSDGKVIDCYGKVFANEIQVAYKQGTHKRDPFNITRDTHECGSQR